MSLSQHLSDSFYDWGKSFIWLGDGTKCFVSCNADRLGNILNSQLHEWLVHFFT